MSNRDMNKIRLWRVVWAVMVVAGSVCGEEIKLWTDGVPGAAKLYEPTTHYTVKPLARQKVSVVHAIKTQPPVIAAARQLADGLGILFSGKSFAVAVGKPHQEAKHVVYLGTSKEITLLTGQRLIRLQMFRTDVQDHRDNTYGWTAYSRPRFMVGSFYFHPVGKIIF